MPATPTVELKTDLVREIRLQQGLSRDEVAQRIGYSPNLIAKIETGYYNPSRVVAWFLAQALGVPTERITASGAPIDEPVLRPDRVARVRMPAMSP